MRPLESLWVNKDGEKRREKEHTSIRWTEENEEEGEEEEKGGGQRLWVRTATTTCIYAVE